MKYAKKFMVVPFREEDDVEIERKKDIRESNELTKILQDEKLSDSIKYNNYNELIKKIQSKKVNPTQNQINKDKEIENENKKDILNLYEKIKDLVKNNNQQTTIVKKKQSAKSIKNTSDPFKTPEKKEIVDKQSKKKRKITDPEENTIKLKTEVVPKLSDVKVLRLKKKDDTKMLNKIGEELDNISLLLEKSDFNTQSKNPKTNLIKEPKFQPKQIDNINKVLRSGTIYSNPITGSDLNWEHIK